MSKTLYNEDIVRRNQPPHNLGVVLRCWHDPMNDQLAHIASHAQEHAQDPMVKPLTKGEVIIFYYPSHTREVAKEADFTLVDRALDLGDVVKRTTKDTQSGVVIGIDASARLAHAISGAKLPGWVSTNEIEAAFPASVASLVVYNNWVGQIIESFEEVFVQLGNGEITRVPELGPRVSIGDRGIDILPPAEHHNHYQEEFTPNPRASHNDTVVHIYQTAFAISWLAINQMLGVEEIAKQPRPHKFWSGQEMTQLTVIAGKDIPPIRLEEKVLLRNTHMAESKGIAPTSHGKKADNSGAFEVRTMVVKQPQSTLRVLWQDGTQESISSTEVVPHIVSDSYECWPGDHVVWKHEGVHRHAVVQMVNAKQRTASVLFVDNGTTELVSLLELDVTGNGDTQEFPQSFGVHLGDMVMIHGEGAAHSSGLPNIPVIGELESWALEVPSHDSQGQFVGWRQEFHKLGTKVAEGRSSNTALNGFVQASTWPTAQKINWLGEVTALRLDGLIEVTLPDRLKAIVPLNRISRLSQDMDADDHEEMWHEMLEQPDMDELDSPMDVDGEEEYDIENLEDHAQIHDHVHHFHHHHHHHHHQHVPGWLQQAMQQAANDYANSQNQTASVRGWEEDEDEVSPTSPEMRNLDPASTFIIEEGSEPIFTPNVRFEQQERARAAGAAIQTVRDTPTPTKQLASSPGAGPSRESPRPSVNKVIMKTEEDDESWARFEILPQAPCNHAFVGTPSHQGSKTFTSRLQKEYRVLRSSLPETILVRAYENRTDLLRCLIFGTENTPYEDAPFVIDWILDRDFPQTPPRAHFHSWTQGHGRVNPNLYEEGKVCLSILGTWSGDHTESWSAARSSLLQAFVSIQGLVLVREPWYCEPGFEKMRGTTEGITNSRNYNEKAFILSRNFVRVALETPPAAAGFETAIEQYYYTQGRLERVVNQVKDLIALGPVDENLAESNGSMVGVELQLAVERLTQGGIISLQRALPKLQQLYDKWQERRLHSASA